MVQFFPSIPSFLVPWIQQQKIFYVATAPLSQSGHINISPKGFENTFHIVDQNTVWYEDLSGSGVETIAHLRDNGRMTIMFCAFEGPPRIVRLWGTGTVHEFDTPKYNELIPLQKRQPGSRSVIMQSVEQVSTSCGFSIPFFKFASPRMKLHNSASKKELKDKEAETLASSAAAAADSSSSSSCSGPLEASLASPPQPEGGLKLYWKEKNQKSIDGLPGLMTAFKSTTTFVIASTVEESAEELVLAGDGATGSGGMGSTTSNELDPKSSPKNHARHHVSGFELQPLVGFVLGWLACFVWFHYDKVFPWVKVITGVWKF